MFKSFYYTYAFRYLFSNFVNMKFPTEMIINNNSEECCVFSRIDNYIIEFNIEFRFFVRFIGKLDVICFLTFKESLFALNQLVT